MAASFAFGKVSPRIPHIKIRTAMNLVNNKLFCLIGVLGFALVLRITAIGFLDIEPDSDAKAYMIMAATMLR